MLSRLLGRCGEELKEICFMWRWRRGQAGGATTHPAPATAGVCRPAEQLLPRADAAATSEERQAGQAEPTGWSEHHHQSESPAAGGEYGDGRLEHAQEVASSAAAAYGGAEGLKRRAARACVLLRIHLTKSRRDRPGNPVLVYP